MNWNESGTRLWGIPKGKYLTDSPSPNPPQPRIAELSIMQHLLTLALRPTVKKKRETFPGVPLNVKKEDV